MEHSLNCGVYSERGKRQIGLARLITDYATFVYVCDVFVLDEFRGQGLGVWLMECVASHPDLQGMRRWMLGTKRCTQPLREDRLHAHSGPRPLDGEGQPRHLPVVISCSMITA